MRSWPEPEGPRTSAVRILFLRATKHGEGSTPAAPVTGALGATGGLLVRPVEVPGGLRRLNGITRGVAAGADGWTPGSAVFQVRVAVACKLLKLER